ncbi:MAG: hypothetical protein U0L62_04345, partial [Paludibacteraceae bacterium]|nr:hypothetical protein [Paludibacteraceae bacterium]
HQLLHLAFGCVGGRRDGAACPIIQQTAQCSRSRGIAQQQGGHVIRCVFGLYGFDVFHFVCGLFFVSKGGIKGE